MTILIRKSYLMLWKKRLDVFINNVLMSDDTSDHISGINNSCIDKKCNLDVNHALLAVNELFS